MDEKKWKEENAGEGSRNQKEEKQPILEPFIGWTLGESLLHFLGFWCVMLVVVEYPQCTKSQCYDFAKYTVFLQEIKVKKTSENEHDTRNHTKLKYG